MTTESYFWDIIGIIVEKTSIAIPLIFPPAKLLLFFEIRKFSCFFPDLHIVFPAKPENITPQKSMILAA